MSWRESVIHVAGADGLVSVSRDAPVRSETSTNWIVVRVSGRHASASEMTGQVHASLSGKWLAVLNFIHEGPLRHLRRHLVLRTSSVKNM